MSVSVPLNTVVVSPVPVPVVKVRPVLLASDNVPWETESVTVSRPPLASMSETDNPAMAVDVLTSIDCAPGTTSTGAILGALIWIVAVATAESL